MTHAKKGIDLIIPERRHVRSNDFPLIKVTCANTGTERTSPVRNIYLTHFMRDTKQKWQSMFAGWTRNNLLAIWEGDDGQDSFHISVSKGGNKKDQPTYTISSSALVEAMFSKYGISLPDKADALIALTFKAIEKADDPGTFILYLVA